MATIINPRLAIQVDLPGGEVKVDVTCNVKFTAYELFTMQHGVKFRLDCRLWGADWPDGDDSLYSFRRKIFPDSSPTATESATFSAMLPSSRLNEDSISGDEIYAQLTLKNLETGHKVSVVNTNEISHSF